MRYVLGKAYGSPLMSNEPLCLDALYREHSRRVQATLIRLLGDFELAEEAMQEAFVAAVQQWPVNGEWWSAGVTMYPKGK